MPIRSRGSTRAWICAVPSRGAAARATRAQEAAATALTRRPEGRPSRPWLKPGVLAGAAVPFALVSVRALQGTLGANPIAVILNELGLTALVLLLASLACSPARRIFGWTWPIRIRRELGLFAFFYASVHLLTYLGLDQNLSMGAVLDDILKRPFITVGFAAFVLLIPLTITSTKASVQRLGFRRWQRLHQLAYLAGALAILHFIWRVKLDASQPLIYAAVLVVLLGIRVAYSQRERSRVGAARRQR